MSAPICPDCRLYGIAPTRCRLCGWSGEPRPRKRLRIEDFHRKQKEGEELMARRAQGKLFFVRAYVKSGADADNVCAQLRTIHKDTGVLKPQHYYFFMLDHKPEQELLDAIKAIDGIEKVVVH